MFFLRRAVKIAGGVRVAQHKPPEKPRERKISSNSQHEEEEEVDGEEAEKAPPKTQVVVSGAVCKVIDHPLFGTILILRLFDKSISPHVQLITGRFGLSS